MAPRPFGMGGVRLRYEYVVVSFVIVRLALVLHLVSLYCACFVAHGPLAVTDRATLTWLSAGCGHPRREV